MSLNFNKSTFTSIDAIPENLRSLELYPKVTGMIDHIVKNYAKEWEDVKYKYRGPDIVRDEVVKNIITELGFSYISDVMDTLTNIEFNTLLQFISLVSLLKGSRSGLELILKLLRFEYVIKEWWEQVPESDVYTFEIVIIMDSNIVPDVQKTLDKVKIFARAYVFPVMQNVDFQFSLAVGSRNITTAGFFKPMYSTDSVIQIMGRI
jgi:hypothetical protein